MRQFMIKEKLDAYLILSADPHLNEYLPSFYQSRAFVSGFKGSLQYGIPIVIIFMPLMILVLYVTFKPNLKFQINTDLEQKIPMD
ncbi:hypothetical protein VWM73_11975, partial [Campylobacter coli]